MKQTIQFWTASGITLCCLATSSLSQAQITPDETVSTEVTTSDNLNTITGGSRAGGNLFHSFREFSIPNGELALFNNALDVQNIISRVTGSSISNIDGLIKTNGTANLFLLNPNGIIFGPNASLKVEGSFLASTGSSLNFADGTQFSATAHPTTPLLTVSVPTGLQFGETPGIILNRARISSGRAINSFSFPAGLQVPTGKTLALVGGNVALEGGNLTAGRIELGSVAGSGLVNLNPTDNGWSLGYEGVASFQDIQLSQQAFISTSSNGGDIRVQGRHVTLTGGSLIGIKNLGLEPGGTLVVTALESVELIGTTADGRFHSGLFTSTAGAGNTGNLNIATRRLIIRDGALVSTNTIFQGEGEEQTLTFGEGQGGDLAVNASDSVELIGTSARFPSGLFTTTTGTGNAGNLTIETRQLNVQNGAQASVSNEGTGTTGDLNVAARSITLDNRAALTAKSKSGDGGNIQLKVQDLMQLRHNSMISTASGTEGKGGNAGDITIDTDFFFAVEDSDIIANSFGGPDLKIQINTLGFFLSPDSEVIVNGEEIEIEVQEQVNTPNTPSEEVVDVTRLITPGCSASRGQATGEFVVTGRGGLPPTSREALRSEQPLVDLGTPIKSEEDRASATISINSTSSKPYPIVEAQGWVISANGDVVLTAQAPTVTPHSPWLTPFDCHAPKKPS